VADEEKRAAAGKSPKPCVSGTQGKSEVKKKGYTRPKSPFTVRRKATASEDHRGGGGIERGLHK